MLYSLLYTLAFFALLPYFAYQAVFNRKYLGNLKGRLWLTPFTADSRPAIWLHAVSVGETLAAKPLIAALRQRFPNHRLVISTTTMTGQAIAQQQIAEADAVCYFPFDWRFTVRRALDAVQPEIVVLMESELWLNFLTVCRHRQIPTIVVNGRISDRSFPRSQKFGFFVRKLYLLAIRFLMQSQLDAERAIKLGAPADQVSVSGNLKYDLNDSGDSPKLTEIARQLDEYFALSSSRLIVAGSTCDDEEGIILEAFGRLRSEKETEDVRLLIAPRHPERFQLVKTAHEFPGGMIPRSLLDPSIPWDSSESEELYKETAKRVGVIVLDSIGELAALYRFASIVFVGGSLITKGGHNILEPALYAKPIIVGPHMQNFREITNEFLRREALIQLRATEANEQVAELSRVFVELLRDQHLAGQFGANARQTMEDNRGATTRTVAAIAELIDRPPTR
ncbi:MAG: 3-deoxy-D-manno-octulosonic acid transferase [Acidobacteriota bacterium]|nr:3-deoxy-D-manno-octulosonic acid transferase [Acidobacteriota bacterium]